MTIQGMKIFVTGGSRGIGAAMVKQFAAAGAQVCFTYASNEDRAQALLKELPGSGHLCLPLQLHDEASVEKAVGDCLQTMGDIQGLVNNAGVTRDQLLLRMKTADFDDVITANLRGTFLVTRAFLKPMIKARRGSIVTITSVIGQTGNPGQANYAASKAGLVGFAKSVALEVASRGVRSNCVAPGFIATDMTEQLSEAQKEGILARIPLGRIAEPSEVADCAQFLLSEASRYVTGHTLSVNGGMFMN